LVTPVADRESSPAGAVAGSGPVPTSPLPLGGQDPSTTKLHPWSDWSCPALAALSTIDSPRNVLVMLVSAPSPGRIERMVDRQMLPEGLAQLPPGPALAVALASVDRTRVASADLHVLARARARQVAFEQAALLADMLECAYSPYDAAEDSLERVRELGEFSADQVAFTLVWSRSGAEDQVLLAQDLIERLPVVYAALAAGRIDLYRARAFSEALSRLDDDKARAVAARLIDKAARWTATTLRERLRYHVLRADPACCLATTMSFSAHDRIRELHPVWPQGRHRLGRVHLQRGSRRGRQRMDL